MKGSFIIKNKKVRWKIDAFQIWRECAGMRLIVIALPLKVNFIRDYGQIGVREDSGWDLYLFILFWEIKIYCRVVDSDNDIAPIKL